MSIEPLNSAAAAQVKMVPKVQSTAEKAEVKSPKYPISSFADEATQTVKNIKDRNSDQDTEQQNIQPMADQMKKAVEQINKKMQNSEALFGIHDKTNRVVIKIVDKETKELIRELPPEKTLDMIAKVWELAGLLVDERL